MPPAGLVGRPQTGRRRRSAPAARARAGGRRARPAGGVALDPVGQGGVRGGRPRCSPGRASPSSRPARARALGQGLAVIDGPFGVAAGRHRRRARAASAAARAALGLGARLARRRSAAASASRRACSVATAAAGVGAGVDHPAAGREAVAGRGHHHQVGTLEGVVDGLAPAAASRPRPRPGGDRADPPTTGNRRADVAADELGVGTEAGRSASDVPAAAGTAVPRRQHGAHHVALVERGRGGPGGVVVLDHHAGQGRAHRRLEGAPPSRRRYRPARPVTP